MGSSYPILVKQVVKGVTQTPPKRQTQINN